MDTCSTPGLKIPQAYYLLIPKKELGVLKQKGLGHFITHAPWQQ